MTNTQTTKDIIRSIKFIVAISAIFVSFSVWPQANAATLYAGSANQIVTEGETFVVDWFLDTETDELNLLNLKLNYSRDILEPIEASSGNSIFSLWLESPRISSETGQVTLAGGVPGGFRGQQVPVMRTAFRAKKTGAARIAMDESSLALKNDGRGTPAQLKFQVLNFVVAPSGTRLVEIASPTHPDENQWYQENRVVLKFSARSGEQYSYSLSSNLEIIPDDILDEIKPEYIYGDLPDGIYYFKLNSRLGAAPPGGRASWQEAAVYRVQIDGTPPEKFEPTIGADAAIFGGAPFLNFFAVDKTSGISHYKVKGITLLGPAVATQSPYKLSRPLVGDRIEVDAVDLAGNVRKVYVAYPGLISKSLLGLLGIVAAAGLIILKKRFEKAKLKNE